jgi:hypothetical protein
LWPVSAHEISDQLPSNPTAPDFPIVAHLRIARIRRLMEDFLKALQPALSARQNGFK